jgi:hypothetical protein
MLNFQVSIDLLYQRISNTYKYLNDKTFRYSTFLFVVYAITVVPIVLWSLNKGLIFSDESWYLLLLNNHLPNIGYSEWPSYAKAFYPSDLLSIRYITFSLYIISGIFMSYGVSRFFRISFPQVSVLSLSTLFIFWSPVQFVPNYITFNTFIFYFGIGCFLLMINSDSIKLLYKWGILCGFLFGNLFFIMITNTPYIAILIISLLILRKKHISIFHYWLSLFIGIFFTFIFFFTIIKPFKQYIIDLKAVFSYLPLIEGYGYGIKGLISWLFNAFLYFNKEVFIQALLLFFIFLNIIRSKKTKFLTILLCTCYIGYYLIKILQSDSLNITSPTPIYIFLVFILILMMEKKEWQKMMFCIVFLLLPLFASLGTDVKFSTRSALYLTPLILLIFVLIINNDINKFILLFHGILLLVLIRFSIIFVLYPGWQGYTIKSQNVNLSTIGINQNIKLELKRIEEVSELKKIIPSNSLALINSANYWGYIYLLNLKVPYYYFRFNEKGFMYYLAHNKIESKSMYLLENPGWHFPASVTTIENIVSIDTLPLEKTKGMNLYKINFK